MILIKPDDVYFTIGKEATAEIKIKGSRFIGEACLVKSIEEAQQRLVEIKRREYDATHHCYAYEVGIAGERLSKYSDDGEPGGTAGRPIYDVIRGRKVTNLLLVVTRYYGGTKLGTGGLARAYSEAAVRAVGISGHQKHFIRHGYKVVIDFSLYDTLMKILQSFEVRQHHADFSDRVTLELSVRRSQSEKLRSAIIQLSSGKAQIEPLEVMLED